MPKRFFSVLWCLSIAFMSACAGDRLILSGYKSVHTVRGPGFDRDEPHTGVDFAEAYLGAGVLVAADGVVEIVFSNEESGITIVVAHSKYHRWTLYTHLRSALVDTDDHVARGQTIGEVGLFPASDGVLHVHMELCTTNTCGFETTAPYDGTEDPLSMSVGCFDSHTSYPRDRLVLTYPVVCSRHTVLGGETERD